MKYTVAILLLIIICSSCSSFDRMHYRHVKKVSAHIVPFFSDSIVSPLNGPTATPILCPAVDSGSVVCTDSSIESNASAATIVDGIAPLKKTEEAIQNKKVGQGKSDSPCAVQRRDRSVIIALIFIFGGILLLLYCVFVIPYFNIFLLLILVLELLVGITAFKLIAKGFSIIRSRVRKPKSYKEAG